MAHAGGAIFYDITLGTVNEITLGAPAPVGVCEPLLESNRILSNCLFTRITKRMKSYEQQCHIVLCSINTVYQFGIGIYMSILTWVLQFIFNSLTSLL